MSIFIYRQVYNYVLFNYRNSNFSIYTNLLNDGAFSQTDDVLSSDIPKRPILKHNATALAV